MARTTVTSAAAHGAGRHRESAQALTERGNACPPAGMPWTALATTRARRLPGPAPRRARTTTGHPTTGRAALAALPGGAR